MGIVITAAPVRSTCPCCGQAAAFVRAPLTLRQRLIYDQLRRYEQERGCFPSNDEIAQMMGYGSLATVHEHLHGLQRRGWIVRILPRGSARAWAILPDLRNT